jgi:hypothetical protein
MTLPFSLPEITKIVTLYGGATNGSVTTASDYISCKHAHKVWIVGYTWGTTGTTFPVSLMESVAVGTAGAAVTTTFPIWKVIATTSTDALTRQTDAYTLTIDPDGTDSTMLFCFEWDCAKFTAGYDCLAVKGGTGNAADYCVILAFVAERFSQATPPTVITD